MMTWFKPLSIIEKSLSLILILDSVIYKEKLEASHHHQNPFDIIQENKY